MDRRAVAISVRRASFGYSEELALEDLSLEVKEGEFIGIIGPNGGGKTTLLKLLMGFLKPARGAVCLLGGASDKMRLQVGYVPQVHRSDRDFPITAWELILLGGLSQTRPWKRYPNDQKLRAMMLMQRLGLTRYAHVPFGALSGGLAQRALLARALLLDPPCLFLDEPTAHIDPPSTKIIFSLLDELKGKKTILLVTHDVRGIADRADRILCVEKQANFFAPDEICTHVSMGLYPIAVERPV